MAQPLTQASSDARAYHALVRHNRLVGVLRILVPLLGLLVLAVLAVQIVLGNLAREFSMAGLSVQRDQLVLDAPRYAGVLSNGATYEVGAAAAQASIANLDLVQLSDIALRFTGPDGTVVTARAPQAQLDLDTQHLVIAGMLDIADTLGTTGSLTDIAINWPDQTMTVTGPLALSFADGTGMTAQGADYDIAQGRWSFSAPRLRLDQVNP